MHGYDLLLTDDTVIVSVMLEEGLVVKNVIARVDSLKVSSSKRIEIGEHDGGRGNGTVYFR